MPKSAQSQIFTRVRVAQQLHFKLIKSFVASWSDMFTGKKLKKKNSFKHDKQRHLVSKMKCEIFLVKPETHSTTSQPYLEGAIS